MSLITELLILNEEEQNTPPKKPAKETATQIRERERKENLFVDSDGNKVDHMKFNPGTPNMSWTGDPLKIGSKMRGTEAETSGSIKKRTSAEIKETKSIASAFKKELEAYKKHTEDTNQFKNPNDVYKKGIFKHSDAVVEATEWVVNNIDAFYGLLMKVNDQYVKSDVDGFEKSLNELKDLVKEASTMNKKIVARMSVPRFVSKFRTQSAIELSYMLHARDYLTKTLKKLKMTPEQRERSEKASARMKAMWGSTL